MFSEYQQSTQGLLLQKDEGFFLCALSDFYLYKMYLSLDHAVNQQFKVFLQTSLIFLPQITLYHWQTVFSWYSPISLP